MVKAEKVVIGKVVNLGHIMKGDVAFITHGDNDCLRTSAVSSIIQHLHTGIVDIETRNTLYHVIPQTILY